MVASRLTVLISIAAFAAASVLTSNAVLAAPVQKAAQTSSAKSSTKNAKPASKITSKTATKPSAKSATKSKPAPKPATKTSLEATEQNRAALQKEQAQLQKELDTLKSQLSAIESTHQKTSSELAKSEVEISRINSRLRDLDTQKGRVEKRLRELRDEERSVTGQMTSTESALRDIARAQYVNITRNPWQALISGRNPHAADREKAALTYFSDAGLTRFQTLSAKKTSIVSISEETIEKQKTLSSILNKQKENRSNLLDAQKQRRTTLETLTKEMNERKANIERIEKDQARLEALSRRIEKILADREREQRRKALAQAGKSGAKQSTYVPPDNAFSKKKGTLMMPVLGKITGRFGENRENLSGISTKWKGVLIEARQGTDVLACESGTVIFSDWVQGWGNTLYIDHGSGFLSVYAYNESLYRNVGEKVRRGETIASVGNTGGAIGRKPALYFELRHASIPLNPLQWVEK